MRMELERIEEAYAAISREFKDTPQFTFTPISDELGAEVVLKIETCNSIRCFKGRGSEIAVLRAKAAGARSTVCASAGNLGQAIALCSAQLGLPATVFASRTASPGKLKRITQLGAKLSLVDGDIEVARQAAIAYANEQDAFLIEDSENLGTCEGAATIGLEIARIDRELDAILLALGGGAMASGVGYVIKKLSPQTEVISVQPVGAPAMTLSWQAKKLVTTESTNTIADGVAGRYPIGVVLEDLLEVIDSAILVEESSIKQAMRLLFQTAGQVVEPSAALGVAALLENRDRFAGKRVATILCGANVDNADFLQWTGIESHRET